MIWHFQIILQLDVNILSCVHTDLLIDIVTVQDTQCSTSDPSIVHHASYYNANFRTIGRKTFTGTGDVGEGVLNPDIHYRNTRTLPYDSGFPIGTRAFSYYRSDYNYKFVELYFPGCILNSESSGVFFSTVYYDGIPATTTFVQVSSNGIL